MRRCGSWVVCLLAALAPAGLAWSQTLQEGLTDIVFVLDVSASMQTDDNFAKIRDRLIEFIEDEVDLGTNVAVVTFGESARLVARQAIEKQQDRAAVVARLKQMTADAQATYMAAGIDLALAELTAMRKSYPDRTGMLVMLTDGKNQPPQDVPPKEQITFEKLRQKYAGTADFQPGKDWFFWYCFIGDVNPEVREFAESMRGEAKPVTGPWKFLKVRFNRVVLRLPDVAPGNWEIEYPTPEDRALGEQLTLSTQNPGDYILQISNVILDDPQPGEKIVVAPRSVTMDRAEQDIVLKFSGQNIAPGDRRGRIIFRAPGKMVFIKPQQFHVTFRAVEARVALAPREGVDFGRVLPGQSTDRTVELLPNEAAMRAAGDTPAEVVLPDDLPAGVQLSAEPSTAPLSGATSVRLRFSVAADAALPPDGYRGELKLQSAAPVEFAPAGLPITIEGSRPTIDVTPPSIDFGTLSPGGESVREIFLIPNEAARFSAPTVQVGTAAELAKVDLQISPPAVELREKAKVQLTLRFPAGEDLSGDLEGSVKLTVDQAAVALSPEKVNWRAKASSAVIDVTPAEVLDFGTMEAGGSVSRSIWLSPNEAAAAAGPTIELAVEDAPPGCSVQFEPPRISLRSKQEVRVTLTPGQAAGAQRATVLLRCDSPDVETSVDQLTAIFSVQVAGVSVDAKELFFADVARGTSRQEKKVRVTASQGAVGNTVRLQWELGDLPDGMTIEQGLEQFTVSQPTEEVSFPLLIRGAKPGVVEGTIKLSADCPVRPRELPVRIEVVQPRVEVLQPEGPISRELSRFRPTLEEKIPVVLRANRLAEGAVVRLTSPEGCPNGLTFCMEPSEIVLREGENEVVLAVNASFSPSFSGQDWSGELPWQTDREGIVLQPAAVEWDVVIPPLRTYVILALVLIAIPTGVVLRKVWPRRVLAGKEMIGGLRVVDVPPGATVLLNGAPQSGANDMRIGALRKRRIVIGSATPKDKPPADVTIKGDDGVRKQHAMIYNRGGVHMIRAVKSIDIEKPKHRHIGRGNSERLYDHDQIRVGDVLLEFREPGAKRRT